MINEIAEIIESTDAFSKLAYSDKERLGNMFFERAYLLGDKIKVSPYDPHSAKRVQSAALTPAGIGRWAANYFDAPGRAGAAILALATEYFPQGELDNLLVTCARQLAARDGTQRVKRKIFPLTPNTDVHARFIHQLDTTNIDRGGGGNANLRDFVAAGTHMLASLVDGQLYANHDQIMPGYPTIAGYLSQLLNQNCTIIEDWTLSGQNLATGLSDFIRLCGLLFPAGEVRDILEYHGHKLPTITVVLQLATTAGLDRCTEELKKCSPNPKSISFIHACLLDDGHRLTKGGPPWIARLKQNVPNLNVAGCVDAAIASFVVRAGAECENHFKLAGYPPSHKLEDLVRYGFGPGGWLLVRHTNCPNDSLPLLWFSVDNVYEALFPRADSSKKSSDDPDKRYALAQAEKGRDVVAQEVLRVVRKNYQR